MLQEGYDYLNNREFFNRDPERMYGVMLSSIESDDIETLRALIEDGIDVNNGAKYLIYPINYATLKGREEMVRLLLESGANPNQVDGVNHTPLFIAVRMKKSHKIAEMLLDAGGEIAKTQATRPAEAPLLNSAVMDGDLQMVKVLIKGGANPNESDMMPLLLARDITENRSSGILKVMVDAGLDLEKRSGRSNETILTLLVHKLDGFKYKPNQKKEKAVTEGLRVLINAGANPARDFKSMEEMRKRLGPLALWYKGDVPALERRFKSAQIRKEMF